MDFRSGLVLTVMIYSSAILARSLLFVDATRAAQRKYDVPAYFAFGDSLADVGINNFLPQAPSRADFAPLGKTFFKKPTGRFSEGRNVVDLIAQELELPFAPPFLRPHACFTNGANFASGGSGLLDSTSAGLLRLFMEQRLGRHDRSCTVVFCQVLGTDNCLVILDFNDAGLNEVTAACCGSGLLNAQVGCGRPVPSTMPGVTSELCKHPSKSLFWDVFHPTEDVVRMLFKLFLDWWCAYPISLKALAEL